MKPFHIVFMFMPFPSFVMCINISHSIILFLFLFFQIIVSFYFIFLVALRSLHKKNFIHRDLKLDNVMFLEKSSDSPIKIIDLGNVVELDTSDAVFKGQHMVGTPGFLAPETILHKEYSKKSDIWQAGCTLYSLLSGLPPFDPNNNKQVTEFAYYPMTGPAWDDISTSAKSLVTKMLKRNPDHRISVSDILDHPWLVDEAPNKEFNRDYFTRIKHLALRNKMKAFFLETSLLEGHTKRRKSLRDAIPIFRHASDVALLSASHSRSQSQFEVVDQVDEGTRNDVEAFQSKMRILKNMVVTSIAGGGGHWGAGVGGRKEINYTAFTELLTECHLQELCTLHVFNIFDIGNTGTIDPREFLLTMLAFRTDNGGAGGEGSSSGASGIPAMLARHKENKDEDGDPFSGSVSMSHVTDSQHHQQPAPPGENEDEIRLLFNVFDIKETGYIDLEELKIAVNFLLYMGSDQPQALPNIHELFSIIDVSQNGRIDYPEFKQFYRHLIASHIPQAPVSLTND